MMFLFGKDDPEPASDPIILQESVDDVTLRFLDYEVIGGTLVPTPAFGDAQVALTADGGKLSVAHPGVGNVWVEMAVSESGWPIPRRVVVGGMIEPWEDMPLLASAIRPTDLAGLSGLVKLLDDAQMARLVTLDEARGLFAAAIRERQ
jgi:hypothetical protein